MAHTRRKRNALESINRRESGDNKSHSNHIESSFIINFPSRRLHNDTTSFIATRYYVES